MNRFQQKNNNNEKILEDRGGTSLGFIPFTLFYFIMYFLYNIFTTIGSRIELVSRVNRIVAPPLAKFPLKYIFSPFCFLFPSPLKRGKYSKILFSSTN